QVISKREKRRLPGGAPDRLAPNSSSPSVPAPGLPFSLTSSGVGTSASSAKDGGSGISTRGIGASSSGDSSTSDTAYIDAAGISVGYTRIVRYLDMPVPAGISFPMMTFSFSPSSESLLPEIAASVSTRVVSWNDAADSHE